jgi:hypothetical protein
MATFSKRNGKYQVQIRRKGFPAACRTFHLKSDAEEWARYMETKADIDFESRTTLIPVTKNGHSPYRSKR